MLSEYRVIRVGISHASLIYVEKNEILKKVLEVAAILLQNSGWSEK